MYSRPLLASIYVQPPRLKEKCSLSRWNWTKRPKKHKHKGKRVKKSHNNSLCYWMIFTNAGSTQASQSMSTYTSSNSFLINCFCSRFWLGFHGIHQQAYSHGQWHQDFQSSEWRAQLLIAIDNDGQSPVAAVSDATTYSSQLQDQNSMAEQVAGHVI